ncbi:MAG TPA: NAD(P)/FAD-dependent oxidoreductase [Candidatus Elarobacter sp.]|jgi:monoamine oxidase|nr:NAD(P)/FAD-dependent oxidoreductase [Candidatus Elarobacter sp.]
MTEQASQQLENVDVAIVGGGVSGLYTGWRLKLQHRDRRIVVFESSDYRTGGRLMSAIPPGMPNVPAELGGMRFLNTQPIVSSLARYLALKVDDFPVSEANNIAYLRGALLRRRDLTDPAKVPYRLRSDERGKTIGQLMEGAMEKIVPGITKSGLTPQQRRDLAQARVFLGRPLYEWGFWNALARVLSFEAYQFVADASGYDTTVSNWNAADAIPWFLADFGSGSKYLFPSGGMQGFPDGIRRSFEEQGGEVRLDHTVTRVARTGSAMRLEFARRAPVEARQVVLAMPRRSLELIDLEPAFGAERMGPIRAMIESVSPQPLFKLFACFTKPWWREAPLDLRQGQTTTDVPIRQIYYFRTEGEVGGDPRNTNSLMMATYDDGRNIKYWIGFLREPERAPKFEDETGADAGDEQWRRNRPPETMVDEIHRLVAEVHGLPVDRVPRPYAAAYRDWGLDPFGGGYNLWKIHARSPQVVKEIVRPDPSVPLFICGEAYSNDQGWVEGALETAEDMLRRFFDAPQPNWLHAPSAPAERGETTSESATLRY